MIAYILIILLFAITLVPEIKNENIYKTASKKLNDIKFTNSVLLIWIIFELILRSDFSPLMIDINWKENFFDYFNFGFSIFSFLLIFISRFLKNITPIIILIIIDLTIWLIRYFYFERGLMMGLTTLSDDFNTTVLYGSIGLFLRLKFLANVSKFKFLKRTVILLFIILIVSIKIFLIPYPHVSNFEKQQSQKMIEATKKIIIGNWKGIVKYDSTWTDTLAVYSLDTPTEKLRNHFDQGADEICISSTHKYVLKYRVETILDSTNVSITRDMIISSNRFNGFMNFEYYSGGELFLKDTSTWNSFHIRKLTIDSLDVLFMNERIQYYKYKLTRE